jgi:hypothetical protein
VDACFLMLKHLGVLGFGQLWATEKSVGSKW